MEFETAITRAAEDLTEEEVTYPFTVVEVGEDEDGNEVRRKVECRAYKPEEGQVIVLMADVMSRRADLASQIAGAIDFLTDVLDEESKDYIVRRLMDRKDPFGMAELQPIINWMMEEWGGRPTKQPSDFARSRKAGGQSSTRRTSRSTSSGSRRTAS